VLIGQTAEIAPADRKMYALRDVTATVESVPLIAGSIMSKKLAEGIDALVLDVKTGDGAFMKEYEDSVALAQALVGIGTHAGKKVVAFLTEMDQPLGFTIGNWVEVVESIECLRGKNIPDLMEVTYVLGGAMVWLGGKAASIEEGIKQCQSAIWSGAAYQKFVEIVSRQGGDTAYVEQVDLYRKPKHLVTFVGTREGYIEGFATRMIGVLATELGAGRQKADDVIDPTAGIILKKKIGDQVAKGDVIAEIMSDRDGVAERVCGELAGCITIGANPVSPPPRIRSMVDATGVKRWTTPPLQ
jgi:pyrimidine-nucleoside phosphorylase